MDIRVSKGIDIPLIIETNIPHETFIVFSEGFPKCKGIVINVNDLN